MSFSVNQRTQEFGIRMALGADARRIFRMVMTQGAWQLGIGLVLGRGRDRVVARSPGCSGLEKYSLQSQRARSFHLFRRSRDYSRSLRRFPVSFPRAAPRASIQWRRFVMNNLAEINQMLDDLRYAVRQLVKNPSFTVIAVFALALGIGANTAIFSVVNAVLLRPLPYPDADKLIVLRERSHIFDNGAVGYMNWLDWHAGQQSFTDIALVRRESFNFSVGAGHGSPERVRGVRASSGFLSVLGLKPKIGRDLSAVDDIAGAPNVALISENLWRHDFGASPSVLGRRVLIDGLQREIIGVFPAELQFGRNPDVLLPLSEIAKEPWMLTRDYHQGWSGLGRLKPGVTISQATSDLNAIAIDLEKKYPQSNAGRRVRMRPLFETTVGDYRASLNLLVAAVVCVLLIACANVANLQFARALARGRKSRCAPRSAPAAGVSRGNCSSKAHCSRSSEQLPEFC